MRRSPEPAGFAIEIRPASQFTSYQGMVSAYWTTPSALKQTRICGPLSSREGVPIKTSYCEQYSIARNFVQLLDSSPSLAAIGVPSERNTEYAPPDRANQK